MKNQKFYNGFFFVCLVLILSSSVSGYLVIDTYMTAAANTTNGRSVICTSAYNVNYACWRAWDLITPNGVSDWASSSAPTVAAPQNNTMYLNANKIVVMYQFKYDTESPPPSYSYCPVNWTFQGSTDNGTTWVHLDRRIGDMGYLDVWKNFTTNATVNYNAYRISITKITNSTPLEISEFYLYESGNVAPNFANLSNNGTSAKYGESVQFNFTVTDDNALSAVIAATNMSGTWANETAFEVAGTNYVYQYNLTNNKTRGSYVCARVYANDTGALWNNSADNCFTVQNTLPVVYLYLPANNTHNNQNLTTNFSVIDADNETVSCYLYVNSAVNQTITSATLGANISLNATGMIEQNYSWFVGCNDTADLLQNTSLRNYVVDVTNPIETSVIMPLNDNSSRGNKNLTLNITGFDTYLYGINLTVFYSNGTVFYNETRVNLTPPSYSLTQQINLSVVDNYTVTRCWADSHTAADLIAAKSISYDLLNRKIIYALDKTEISISLLNASNIASLKSFNTTKLYDRYTFTYDLSADKTTIEKTYVFRVVSSEKIYLIKSNYPAHAVTGKYWIDFDIPNAKVEVLNYGEKFYDVKVVTKENRLVTNSLGGLNEICYSGKYIFEKYAPSAPVIVVPINATYDNEINITYLASYSPNNDTLNYYSISLLNYDGSLNATISANNSLNLSFFLNTSNLTDASYRVNVSVFDVNGLSNESVSAVFTIYHIAPHIAPNWTGLVNNATLYTVANDTVQFNVTFADNIQLKNYTFFINGVNVSNATLTGTVAAVVLNYTVGAYVGGDIVCGHFVVYDNDSNSNITDTSCFTIYSPSIFSSTVYGAFLFIGLVLLIFGLLFFAEYINSLALRFIASIALIGFGVLVWGIYHLFGATLIGIALLLMIRSFMWR